jgi:sugar (pentulose or hexulose) kinase
VALPGLIMERERIRPSSGATASGLPVGTPVVAGASDGMLAKLSVGAVAPGVAACSIGTSGGIQGVVPEPRVDDQGRVFCYVLVPDRWSMRASGLELSELRATGGFARSPFWRRLLADVLGTAIGFPASAQGSAVGAALLGHVALGHLPSIDEAAALVQVSEVVHPDPHTADLYREPLPSFAATAEAVEALHAWRQDPVPGGRLQSMRRCEGSVTS